MEEHRFVRLPDLREAEDMPGARFGVLPPTYIPLRNSIFYSFAASYAEETGASLLVGGHNRDDERVFRDVSSDFFTRLEGAFVAASPILSENEVRISRPLRDKSKPDVIRLGASKGVPLELTWSCHRTGKSHCWECEGCLSREKGFLGAGVEDPLAHLVGRKLLKR